MVNDIHCRLQWSTILIAALVLIGSVGNLRGAERTVHREVETSHTRAARSIAGDSLITPQTETYPSQTPRTQTNGSSESAPTNPAATPPAKTAGVDTGGEAKAPSPSPSKEVAPTPEALPSPQSKPSSILNTDKPPLPVVNPSRMAGERSDSPWWPWVILIVALVFAIGIIVSGRRRRH
jgi:hypothetical protein